MELALPKNFHTDDAPDVLDRARPLLDLPANAELRVEDVTKDSQGTRIGFSCTYPVELDDIELHNVTGICVDVNSHGDLCFDAHGCLLTYTIEPADPHQLRAFRDHLTKLLANGQVYVAQPGEEVDAEELRRRGMAWYVEQDAQGTKHLKRAWIS